jgi:hypothetical protein
MSEYRVLSHFDNRLPSVLYPISRSTRKRFRSSRQRIPRVRRNSSTIHSFSLVLQRAFLRTSEEMLIDCHSAFLHKSRR